MDSTIEDLAKIMSPSTEFSASPKLLLQKVWWDIHYNFARRGRENDRIMTKTTFKVKKDSEGHEFIEPAFNEFTKNHRGELDDTNIYPRCYANDTPSCPVKSFKLYVTKLHPLCDALWQKPRPLTKFLPSDHVWYADMHWALTL